MTIEAELPDGRVLEFPDDTPREVVQATVKKMLGVQSAPQQPAAQQQQQVPKPTNKLLERAMKLAGGFVRGGPMGVINEGVGMGLQGMDKVAYEAGGMATDLAVKAGASPEVAGGIGTVVNVAGPSVVGGAIAKSLASPALQAGARKFMQSALKPSIKALKSGKADEAVETLLEEGVNVSRGGVAKLEGKIDDINDQIADLLQKTGGGKTVDKHQVAARIQDVFKRIENTYSTPQDALKAVEKVYDDFLSNHLIPKDIPVAKAHELKQGIYRMLKDQYGKLGSETVEAQKALGRGYKELVAEQIPEIGQLNAQESKMINALLLAEHRALISGNKDIGGIVHLVRDPKLAASFLADRSPLFKSVVARLMNANSGTLPTAAGAAAGGAYQTIQSKKQ